MYKAGIIGCGWIGVGISWVIPNKIKEDTHANAYKNCPKTDLVMVHDSILEHAQKAGEMWKVKFTSKLSDLFGLDIVSVCTPPETHLSIIRDIAPYVKAIYCEKPIAENIEDAKEIINVCEKNHAILQINHTRRFTNPIFRFGRELMDTGTHVFDLLRSMFGDLVYIDGKMARFKHGPLIEIQYVDTSNLPWDQSHIFEFDITHKGGVFITKGVQHLVECLELDKQSISSGYEALKTLEALLLFKESMEIQNGKETKGKGTPGQ